MARTPIHFEEKREELLRVAFQLFLEKGYEKTTINDILKRADISKGGMYHYFNSKDEILDGVLTLAFDEVKEQVDATFLNPKLNAIDKFMNLVCSIDKMPELVEKLITYAENDPRSLVAYRVRDFSVAFSTPYLKIVIMEGIEEGIFKAAYPGGAAQMIATAGNHLFDSAAYSNATQEEQKELFWGYINMIQSILHVEEDWIMECLLASMKIQLGEKNAFLFL